MTKSIIIAGLLGGLLGGVASFAANRFIKPVEVAKPHSEPSSSAAREVADAFVSKLKAAKFEEFIIDAKRGMAFNDEKETAAFKARLNESRILYTHQLGPSLGEFELLRETALSPSLVRFVYLEKFERGGVWWVFVMYHGKDSWQLSWANHGAILADIFAQLS